MCSRGEVHAYVRDVCKIAWWIFATMPLVILLAPAAAGAADSSMQSDIRAPLERGKIAPWVVRIIVNGRAFDAQLVLEANGTWWVDADEIAEWGLLRVELNGLPSLTYGGQRFYDVRAAGAHSVAFNESTLQLELVWSADSFVGAGPLNFGGRQKLVSPSRIPVASFANYAISLEKTPLQNVLFSGEIEVGVSSALGLGTTDMIVSSAPGQVRIVRYTSALRRDWADSTRTLIIGDSIGKPGLWGTPVHFGGLHYFSNFSLQPGFVTYPSPRYEGLAAAPSSVSVFLNQRAPQTLSVQPGPFAIADIATPTGTNEVVYLVKDALGREVVTRQTFYAFRELLRQDLHDFSFELGAVRRNLGVTSFDYGRLLAVATSKYGWTEKLTTELRGQVYGKAVAVGAGAIWSTPLNFGLVATAVGSMTSGKSGSSFSLGVQRRETRWSAGADVRVASSGFTQDVADDARNTQHIGWSAFASRRFGWWGDVSFMGAGARNFDGEKNWNTGVQLSRQWLRDSHLYLSANVGENGKVRVSTVGLSIRVPLSRTLSVASSVSRSSDGSTTLNTTATDRMPQGLGYGWRASAQSVLGGQSGRRQTFAARASARGSSFDALLDVAHDADGFSARGNISGAVGLIDGTFFAARRIEEGFGLVRVEGSESVGLRRNSIVFARTDRRGIAVLPRLSPYADNYVEVDVRTLPLDVSAEPAAVNLVTAYRGGATGTFKLIKSASAMVHLVRENGQPPTRGSEVFRDDQANKSLESYVVGANGKVYVTDLTQKNRFIVKGLETDCAFDFEVPAERFDVGRRVTDVLQITPVICKEIQK